MSFAEDDGRPVVGVAEAAGGLEVVFAVGLEAVHPTRLTVSSNVPSRVIHANRSCRIVSLLSLFGRGVSDDREHVNRRH